MIRDSAEDAPLVGVAITLQANSLFKDAEPCVTGADGSFVLTFRVSDNAFSPSEMPKWTLSFAKSGFVDQVIDISPSKEPQSAQGINLISVVAYVKPTQ